jgi:hypothetical protein
MTGEVITLDGGEVLNGGQFNFLNEVTPEMWDVLEAQIKNANRASKQQNPS